MYIYEHQNGINRKPYNTVEDAVFGFESCYQGSYLMVTENFIPDDRIEFLEALLSHHKISTRSVRVKRKGPDVLVQGRDPFYVYQVMQYLYTGFEADLAMIGVIHDNRDIFYEFESRYRDGEYFMLENSKSMDPCEIISSPIGLMARKLSPIQFHNAVASMRDRNLIPTTADFYVTPFFMRDLSQALEKVKLYDFILDHVKKTQNYKLYEIDFCPYSQIIHFNIEKGGKIWPVGIEAVWVVAAHFCRSSTQTS